MPIRRVWLFGFSASNAKRIAKFDLLVYTNETDETVKRIRTYHPETGYLKKMSPYQQEQLEALQMVLEYRHSRSAADQKELTYLTAEYLAFRKDVNAFLAKHLSDICTQKCYQSRLSACCSREGIITFFADWVINVEVSSNEENDTLIRVLTKPYEGFKCIYLGRDGCLWRVKPIVCEMFICDPAREKVIHSNPAAQQQWEDFMQLKKQFTWPDRPVLFDAIETIYLEAGYCSPLMYLHNSPGLLRVKQQAGLKDTGPGVCLPD